MQLDLFPCINTYISDGPKHGSFYSTSVQQTWQHLNYNIIRKN